MYFQARQYISALMKEIREHEERLEVLKLYYEEGLISEESYKYHREKIRKNIRDIWETIKEMM